MTIEGHAPVAHRAQVLQVAWVVFLPPVSGAVHRAPLVQERAPVHQVAQVARVPLVDVVQDSVDKLVDHKVAARVLAVAAIVAVPAKRLANKNARTWSSCNHCSPHNTHRVMHRFLKAQLS